MGKWQQHVVSLGFLLSISCWTPLRSVWATSDAADDETELTDVGGPRPQLMPVRNLQFLEDLHAARTLFSDSYLGLSTARITPATGLRWPAPTWASTLIRAPMAS